jgi:predicted nucleotidyltransferase
MNIFDDYTRSLLNELNNNKVEYIVVGGYAVNYHGYRRTTGDIDLWIKPENGINKKNILSSLKSLEVDDNKLTQLEKLDFTEPIVFVDGEEPFKIDFMTFISGVTFSDAWQKMEATVIDGLKINFIHIDHLVISKIATDRLKDKLDIEMLQKIKQAKNKE